MNLAGVVVLGVLVLGIGVVVAPFYLVARLVGSFGRPVTQGVEQSAPAPAKVPSEPVRLSEFSELWKVKTRKRTGAELAGEILTLAGKDAANDTIEEIMEGWHDDAE